MGPDDPDCEASTVNSTQHPDERRGGEREEEINEIDDQGQNATKGQHNYSRDRRTYKRKTF